MNILCFFLTAGLLGFLAVTWVSAEPLDLREAQRMALERNLDLRAETFATRASDAVVRSRYGLYDPRATATFAEGADRDRVNSQVLSVESEVEYRRFDFSLTQKLPTGADLTAALTNRRQRTLTDPRPGINPSYDSELRLTLAQPLLRNFGRTVTEEQILFAVKDREISVDNLRESAFALVASVRDAFFEILRARDQLDYRQTSVALAEKVLTESRARVDAGVLPPVDLLEAEVGLKARERELLDARRDLDDAHDNLALLINLSAPFQVAPEALGQPEIEAGEEMGLRSAFELRPDLLRQGREIERQALESRIARNRALPSLDLTGSYAHKGLGEDYSDVADDLASEDLRGWEVGLTLSYPLGNREARNDYRRSELRLKEAHSRLAQLREEVRREVRAALRGLEVSRKKIEVASQGRELAEEKLRILLKRKEVGLATTRDVLEGEDDLAAARTDQIAALAEYNGAVTAYLKVTGQLLEHEGIRIAALPEAGEEKPIFGMDPR